MNMQTVFERIFGGALALLFFVGATSTTMEAQTKQARVSQVIQDVRLLEPRGAPRPAVVNDKVTEEMGVRTGVQSRAELVFADLTLTRLGANTIFSFKQGTRELDLTSGAVLLQVPPNQAAVKVNTSAITAAVTGGTAMLSTGPPTKFMVLEGTGTFYPVGHPERAVTVGSGQMMMMTPDRRMTKPEKFDVKLVMKTSGLIKNFPPLQNLPLIMTVVDQQIAEQQLAGATSQPLARNLIDTIGTTDQNINANPVVLVLNSTPTPPPATPTPPPATPTPPPATPTPPPATPTPPPPTPTKFGTPATITSPNPYVITSGTLITTDPSITTDGLVNYGKIYRGQSVDGLASAWAFGSTSAFDTASGFDALIGDTSGAAFKFTALQLTGNPTIDITNGETNLGLIAVNGITSGGPGGVLNFTGISGLLLATQNGSITLGPEISFSGLHDLTIYARGSNSDLTLGSDISTSSQLRLLAERDMSITSSITTDDLYAFVGRDVTISGSGAIHAPTITLFAGENLNLSDLTSDETASSSGGNVTITAGQAINVTNDLNITRENGGISSGLNTILTTGTDLAVGGDTTLLVNNNASQVGDGARILSTIGGNLQTNNLTVELLNNGGEIDSGGNVSLEVLGSITAHGDATFEIQNTGGTMGQDAPIQLAGASLSANSLLAQIDNSNGGVIGGDAHIFMTIAGDANVTTDATLAIFGSDGAANSSILVNGGKYDVGGTFLSFIDGNGTVTFNNATAHADVLKAGVFGANGVLNIGGGTLSADTTLKLYAPGSNGQLNFVSDVTLGGNSAKILAANSVTIFDNVVVTIGGKTPADVYTNNANYTGFGGNGSTTGTFAGAGANNPLPLSQAPPFEAPSPRSPRNEKRTQTVINIKNSGQLLSLLDSTVPGRDGKLKVPPQNQRQAVNTDRLNVNRMIKADRDMADIRRMRDRGIINSRIGSGTRSF
jgi:hypothetical protein